MAIFFLVFATVLTIGCIIEIDNDKHCAEGCENCSFMSQRAIVYSAVTTLVVWICGLMWLYLLWDAYAPDRQNKLEQHVRISAKQEVYEEMVVNKKGRN
jgi:uncharacterized BrkB/YihY/UPF0761 family membrane protein